MADDCKGQTEATAYHLIESLDDELPWVLALYAQAQHFTWEPRDLLGITKRDLYRRVIRETTKELSVPVSEEQQARILKAVERRLRTDMQRAAPADAYSKPIVGDPIKPTEAQRRLRLFSEIVLNHEFDVLMSLLPNAVISQYIADFFDLERKGKWRYFGNSEDLNNSLKTTFIQPDGLLYNETLGSFVGVELKLNGALNDDQIEKYCGLFVHLKRLGMIMQDSTFRLLLIGAETTSSKEISDLKYRARNNVLKGKTRALKPMREEILVVLDNLRIEITNWQEFGDYLLSTLAGRREYGESYAKLIKGFIWALEQKYSFKKKCMLYEPSTKERTERTHIPHISN